MAAKMLPVSYNAECFIDVLLNGGWWCAYSQQRMPPTESLTLLTITKLVRSHEFIACVIMAVGHIVLCVCTCTGTGKFSVWSETLLNSSWC